MCDDSCFANQHCQPMNEPFRIYMDALWTFAFSTLADRIESLRTVGDRMLLEKDDGRRGNEKK